MNTQTKLRNNNPQFCIITPTKYLDKYAAQSSMHLVLAHLVDEDDDYALFYRYDNKYKIMDNGTFELGESYTPEKLVFLGEKCKANAIVLPDYPDAPAAKTTAAAKALIEPVHEAGYHTFFCPQAEVGNLEGWIQSYKWAADNPLIDMIGMSILAIPNALPHIPRSYARVVMTQILIERGLFNFGKYHHYLGLNAGPALEIPPLLKMGALDSCDSSGPVWSGICGQTYCPAFDSYAMTRKIDKHVDFSYPMVKTPYVHQAIQTNIDLTLQLFDEGRTGVALP